MPNERWVFWLNLTNLGLGIVTVLAVFAVAYGVVWEFVFRRKRARGMADMDREGAIVHGQLVPELGLTMADGGEPVKPSQPRPTQTNREQKQR